MSKSKSFQFLLFSFVIVSMCYIMCEKTASAQTIWSTGTCGANVRWRIEKQGNSETLYIYGTGATYDYRESIFASSGASPFADKDNNITNVVVEEGVTSIGTNLFYKCTGGIFDVTLPNTITTIKKNAFMYSNIRSINIPDSVLEIGDYAFFRCNSIQTITISSTNKIAKIGENCFCCVLPMESILIPKGISFIPPQAYSEEKIKSVYIPGNVKTIGDSAFCSDLVLKTVTIASGVEKIDVGAFARCHELDTVHLPESLKYIGEIAFENTSISKIYIPKTVTYIGPNAFPDNTNILCWKGSVAAQYAVGSGYKVTYMDSNGIPFSGVTVSISNASFTGKEVCPKPTVTYKGKALTQGTDYYIEYFDNLFPGTATAKLTGAGLYFGSYTAYYNITLSETEYRILHLPSNLKEIGEQAFSYLPCQAVLIPDGCTTIGSKAFLGCNQLIYVRIPASVTNIAKDAFSGCSNVLIQYK